jgi:GT2 family glycosyltransferase
MIIERPLVSIIILNYNGKCFLKNCLSTVFETNYPNFEVIFVDNASTDKSLDFVSKVFAEKKGLKLISNRRNLGFGPACNVGFNHAKGDYIVFLNNDTVVEPDWLATLVDALENDQTIGLAQSLIFNIGGQMVQSAGFLMGDYSICKHWVVFPNDRYKDMLPNVFEISHVMGAAMIAKREFLQEIGLFDPKYFWYYDDEYLSFRTWLAGKRVVTVAGSKVFHHHAGTSRREIGGELQRHWVIKNFSLVFDVYWNFLDLAKGLFILSLDSIYSSLKESLRKRDTQFLKTMSGIRWILENFRYIWRNRLKYWSKAVVNEKTLRSRMIRINIPSSVYLVPKVWSPYSLYFRREIHKYRKNLMLLYKQELECGQSFAGR